jgi:hypothetical protein
MQNGTRDRPGSVSLGEPGKHERSNSAVLTRLLRSVFFSLVCILQEEVKDRLPACVDPEDEHWIESEAFEATEELADSINVDRVRLEETSSLS